MAFVNSLNNNKKKLTNKSKGGKFTSSTRTGQEVRGVLQCIWEIGLKMINFMLKEYFNLFANFGMISYSEESDVQASTRCPLPSEVSLPPPKKICLF